MNGSTNAQPTFQLRLIDGGLDIGSIHAIFTSATTGPPGRKIPLVEWVG
jgi:hypothetical protein